MGRTCSIHREHGYNILIGKPEGKRPLIRDTGVGGRIILKSIITSSSSLQGQGVFPVLASAFHCLHMQHKSLLPLGLCMYACFSILPGLML
jgi:hypothetical protein